MSGAWKGGTGVRGRVLATQNCFTIPLVGCVLNGFFFLITNGDKLRLEKKAKAGTHLYHEL